jgi:glycosylphosphatidylinositol transamidase (GPIT) subunit GPI8
MNENTNVMVYLTGHGGDNFFKFQDGEELMSMDVASTFAQMHELKRYNEILFISDTCQAFTMADEIKAPNVYSIGSSLKGQNSYASHSDFEVGQSVIDRYSKIVKDFLDDSVTMTSLSTPEGAVISSTLDNATVAVLERLSLHDALVRIPTMHGDLGPSSKIGHADHLCSRKMTKVPLADFFAAPASERERQMQQREGGIESSLWMNDVVLEEDTQTTGTEQECSIPTLDEVSAGNTNMKQPIQTTGMSPFDPKFVAMVLGFLWCTKVASRIW